ncbi:MAG: hypothetical protein Q8M26_08865 [Pseudolabrys sp.]|nr:hypothetical protein [Pseudolabrys sp.]
MRYVFPGIMMVASFGAAVVYAFECDWRRAVYWTAATVLTAAVTL